MVINIKGKDIIPRFTIGALMEYAELTGDDLLFGGGRIDTANLIPLCYVALKDGGADITLDECRRLEVKDTLRIMALFTKTMDLSEQEPGEKKK